MTGASELADPGRMVIGWFQAGVYALILLRMASQSRSSCSGRMTLSGGMSKSLWRGQWVMQTGSREGFHLSISFSKSQHRCSCFLSHRLLTRSITMALRFGFWSAALIASGSCMDATSVLAGRRSIVSFRRWMRLGVLPFTRSRTLKVFVILALLSEAFAHIFKRGSDIEHQAGNASNKTYSQGEQGLRQVADC